MESLVERIIKEQSKKINNQKDELINAALKEKGIKIDLKVELKRRFPRVLCEFTHLQEAYYFNDGSAEGLRIITFIYDEVEINPFNNGDGKCVINYSFSWF